MLLLPLRHLPNEIYNTEPSMEGWWKGVGVRFCIASFVFLVMECAAPLPSFVPFLYWGPWAQPQYVLAIHARLLLRPSGLTQSGLYLAVLCYHIGWGCVGYQTAPWALLSVLPPILPPLLDSICLPLDVSMHRSLRCVCVSSRESSVESQLSNS